MSIQNLKAELKKGLYVRNLYKLADICLNEALAGNDPAPFFILAGIFKDIAASWDEMPVEEALAKSIESALHDTLYQLLYALELQASPEQVYNILNSLVSIYLTRIKPQLA